MIRYLLRFTPMEPFFFGNERGLNYPGSKSQYQNLYFVRSENTPSQTTVLGALRFLLLQANGRKTNNYSALSEDKENNEVKLIGPASFKAEEREKQPFGVIKSISPVFLMKGSAAYIPAPMDHNTADEKAEGKYSPLRAYKYAADSLDGPMLYAGDYDLKSGTVSGFVSLTDGEVLKNYELFSPVLRVGINRRLQGKDQGGFFKKEFKKLQDGFSFAVYCELEEDEKTQDWSAVIPSIAYLGQGHTPFQVEMRKADSEQSIDEQARDFLQKNHPTGSTEEGISEYAMIYCLGDAFMTSIDPKDEEKDLYDGLLFGVTDSRDFRSLRTELKGNRLTRTKYSGKQSALYHLMKAGSVLIAPDAKAAEQWIARFQNENASQIGFNTWITFTFAVKEKEETK